MMDKEVKDKTIDTIIDIFLPTNLLNSVDLPTFGLPTIHTVGIIVSPL